MTDSRLVAGPKIPDGEIPEGMRPDARETWPSRELIESFLGDFDFELRPGETIHVLPDPALVHLFDRDTGRRLN